jgi:Putative prokaryotic signal transducing protein
MARPMNGTSHADGDAPNASQRWGFVLLGVAIAVGFLGRLVVPGRVWAVGFVGLVLGALALIVRTRGRSGETGDGSQVRPLGPGESYQHPVRLAGVPNVPLAEVWCQRLRQNGIEAFYKGASPFGAKGVGVTALNPALPVELWVGEDDAARALQLFPELRS